MVVFCYPRKEKMFPDCSQLPTWARWIAQDADGSWWAYAHEPNMADHGWYENELGGNILLQRAEPNPEWREEIHRINGKIQ